MKIYVQPNGKLTEADRLQLASILVKAGYTVSIKKESVDGRPIQIVEANP